MTPKDRLGYARGEAERWRQVASFGFTEKTRSWAARKADAWDAKAKALEQQITQETPKTPAA